jgi:hypothetical protein
VSQAATTTPILPNPTGRAPRRARPLKSPAIGLDRGSAPDRSPGKPITEGVTARTDAGREPVHHAATDSPRCGVDLSLPDVLPPWMSVSILTRLSGSPSDGTFSRPRSGGSSRRSAPCCALAIGSLALRPPRQRLGGGLQAPLLRTRDHRLLNGPGGAKSEIASSCIDVPSEHAGSALRTRLTAFSSPHLGGSEIQRAGRWRQRHRPGEHWASSIRR